MKLTAEQTAAIEAEGKVIVSASAGSGKTFVMIKKLVAAIESGTDIDNILAVTFTKKAAAQMKEKLRAAVIERMEKADGETRARLKIQLSKIPSASISTIHAFCAKILRTYFYAAGVDGGFDIISADDSLAAEFKGRALDALFDRYYDGDNADFKILLKCYRKKRSDAYLRTLIADAYDALRVNADYKDVLQNVDGVYTEEGFSRVCAEYKKLVNEKYDGLEKAVDLFASTFFSPRAEYAGILKEMKSALNQAKSGLLFSPLPPLSVTRKPVIKNGDEKAADAAFKNFRDGIAKRYREAVGDIADGQTEREYFFKSGETAKAFARVLLDFDAEYSAVKLEENKLDYNDLEHLTLAVLSDDGIRAEINAKYSRVFVDEYQDVNPVQESIISLVGGGNVFLVGDVKQAIYGFRGSKSLFFAEKYNRFEGGGGKALKLSSNFRSSSGVINFVNALFSDVMTEASCGFDYAESSLMTCGADYPANYGGAELHIFGSEEAPPARTEVYSVEADGREAKHTREGLAALAIVEKELGGVHYDIKSGKFIETQAGDICILTRKRGGAAGIARALTDAGYAVAGTQDADIRTRPEVKQMLDLLSLIDNASQDIPLATALLSPLGKLSCNELAAVRIAAKNTRLNFRDCCEKYISSHADVIAQKLKNFYAVSEDLRDFAETFTAAEVIDKILEDTGLEAVYSAGNGEKLKNVRRLAQEGKGLSVAAFLEKVKTCAHIGAPSVAASDSIKIMTMHAAKGLEFPVVIIADVCARFTGREGAEMPFGGVFGFAPKYYDSATMIKHNTLLRRLVLKGAEREELKNELNLFYVACTRAMCRLHVLAGEITEYNSAETGAAKCYAQLFDMRKFSPTEADVAEEVSSGAALKPLQSAPDESLKREIEQRFMQRYAFGDSVNLPVKSSASAILRLAEEDSAYRPHALFSGEGETDTARGTAYHAFLELCDFSEKSAGGITGEIADFVKRGLLTEEQGGLLNADELAEILKMPVFENLHGAELFREREFLCTLPADEIFKGVTAKDGVLVQGAIDLLAVTRDGIKIIDYKYSKKSDAQLIQTYSAQLALYKKAAALILKVDEAKIETAIVNIYLRRQIIL